MPDPIHHVTVHFSGHVQGVGFRYSTLQVAKEFEVVGFVQNLPDGRVVVEAEGKRDTLDQFIVAISERLHGYIKKTERMQQMRAPQFQGFEIR